MTDITLAVAPDSYSKLVELLADLLIARGNEVLDDSLISSVVIKVIESIDMDSLREELTYDIDRDQLAEEVVNHIDMNEVHDMLVDNLREHVLENHFNDYLDRIDLWDILEKLGVEEEVESKAADLVEEEINNKLDEMLTNRLDDVDENVGKFSKRIDRVTDNLTDMLEQVDVLSNKVRELSAANNRTFFQRLLGR